MFRFSRYVLLLLLLPAFAVSACSPDGFAVHLVIERINLPVPASVDIVVESRTAAGGEILQTRTELYAAEELFVDEATLADVLIIPEPESGWVEITVVARGVGGEERASDTGIETRRSGVVDMMLSLVGSGDSDGGDAARDSSVDGSSDVGTDSGFDSGNPTPACPQTSPSIVLTVTTTDDELDNPGATDVAMVGGAGDVSLREAFVIANNRGGPETIEFDPLVFIPGVPTIIHVGGGTAGVVELPPLTGSDVCIDAGPSTVILQGNDALDWMMGMPHGINLSSSDNTIVGLAVTGFPADGIFVAGLRNEIRSCWIGEHPAVPMVTNMDDGINVTSGSAIVGPGNVIVGNLSDGVLFQGSGATNGLVVGNFIGVDPVTMMPVGNLNRGIGIGASASFITIGGLAPGEGNFIGGSPGGGVALNGAVGPISNIEILGNWIGTDGTFVPNFGNGDDGINVLTDVSSVNIEGNVIGYNSGWGINLVDASVFAITMTANLIVSNNNSAIRVNGGNGGILPPLITSAAPGMVSGTSSAEDLSTVEIFSDDAGEARCIVALGVTVTGGTWTTMSPTFCGLMDLTATVTDTSGNTSELSPPFLAP